MSMTSTNAKTPTAAAEPLVTMAITTAHGEFTARYSANGLAQLSFPTAFTSMRDATPAPSHLRPQISAWHRITAKALKRALLGQEPDGLPPLDVADGTPFQRSVWRALQGIPTGKTASYGELARSLGRPKAVRALGGACGANPIPVLIPCHRVLAANRKLGGFSGGLKWKRTLLAAEGTDIGNG